MNESNNLQVQWLRNLGISLDKDTKKACIAYFFYRNLF